MNPRRITGILSGAAMSLFLISCQGGSGEKTTTDTTTNATTTPDTISTTSTSTVVTTPQNMMVVTHKVKDFAKWLPAYEGHDSTRLANGIHSYRIGRGLTDSNMVLVVVKVDDLKKAEAFGKSADLKQAMQRSGVVGAPTVRFTTNVYMDTGIISSNLRSRTTFSVKDWNSWKNAFDSSRQQRMDNGISDRAYGHDPNDDHKVTVVVALTDTSKAFAYWKSDTLKKRMAQSGVIGQPARFLYTIVKKY
jgi:hypothetical protein